jgi:hypothetical protein
MKKELFFISACLNINYRSGAKKKLEKLAEKPLDWAFIIKNIAQSGMAPLILQNLRCVNNDNIPAWFIKNLEEINNTILAKNLQIYKMLDDLLILSSREKIPVIGLKGIFMLGVIYNHALSARDLSDIDILIKKNDLEKMKHTLENSGYTRIFEYSSEMRYVQTNAQNNSIIDLHHDLLMPSGICVPVEFMWSRPQEKELNNSRILYPSIEDGLICAALHFFHHLSDSFLYNSKFPALKSILDISEIINRKQDVLDWDYIIEFSKKYKIRYILYLSLMLSKLYFETRIPAKVINKIKPPFIKNKILSIFIKKYASIQSNEANDCFYIRSIKCVYYALFEKPYFKQRLFRPIDAFAKEYDLPYPSIRTYCLYLLRPFLTIFYLKKCS